MKNLRGIAALSAVTISALSAASGCSAQQPGGHADGRPVVLTSSQVATLRAYGRGDTAFGLKLLSVLCHGQPGTNVVLSPVSLATGLGMTSLGARGATAAAMARVLHLPTTGSSLVGGLAARTALLGSLNRPGVTFATSNRIWADPTLVTRSRFVAELRAGYQAGLRHVPLLSRPETARRTINASVAADTRGHIRDLLPPSALAQPTGWVLTDALYLKAAWAHPFDHALTMPGSFSTGSGQVTADYLNGDGFRIATAAGWRAAALPYRGGRLSMLALLPPAAGPGGCQGPGSSTLGLLAARIAARGATSAIALPKVRLAGSESLLDTLTRLGMGIAFTQRANFTGLSPQACCIGAVQHAATLAVGEKGTVASAATAVTMLPTALRVTQLTFSRPYLLLIRDTLTGEPLMLAWVANPTSG
jgi:serpin B